MRQLSFLLGLALTLLAVAPALAGDEGDADRAAWERRLADLDAQTKDVDAKAAYTLALQLEAKGHKDLAAKAYEIVIGVQPDHPAARRALGYEQVDGTWHRGDDLFRAKGFVHHQKRWMTAEEFAQATRPEREKAEQKAGESRAFDLLRLIGTEDPETVTKAKRRFAMVDKKFKLAPLAKALRLKPASLRIFAAEELARLDDPLGVPALIHRAIYDPKKDVRTAAARALKSIDEPDTIHPLGRALKSRYEEVRVHAVEAIGQLGDNLGLGYVIKRWEGRSGDFPQVYFMQARQISYIQDFDVEVAQTSFIADPIVGVIQEGVVQSVKIHATEQVFTTVEHAAVLGALEQLAGTKLGDKLAPWSKFWRENGERLVAERTEKYANKPKRQK
ncbi:MAG: HEAT repeat domain-containing protein [Planctomycetota bacterium]|nr:HEAT repeat domain-containing protein [Planctomycetota bacterium]